MTESAIRWAIESEVGRLRLSRTIVASVGEPALRPPSSVVLIVRNGLRIESNATALVHERTSLFLVTE